MGTSVGVGYSLHKNAADAGKEAALKALQQGELTRPDFVFVFATVGYNQELLIRAIRETTSGAPLAGCSGEGIITQGMVDEGNFAVCVMAIASDQLRFKNVRVKELRGGAGPAGERLAAELHPLLAPDDIACFLFIDGLTFDFDPFREAFEKSLRREPPLPLLGGLAADNWAIRKTYQYHDDEAFAEGISCVLISGNGKVAWGVSHGCVPVGNRRTITRSRGNIICEIDGIPALEALKDYVDEWSVSQWNKLTLNLCLGFRTPAAIREAYGEFFVRYMMDKDDREGSVTIQSDVPSGTRLWIMRRDKELIREKMLAVARQIREQTRERRPGFVLQFECVGRGKAVFREQEKLALLQLLQEEIGWDIPWIGLYTYGEIGPISGCNCLHNFTAVVVAVY